MLRVCFNCYHNYTTDTVYQWDLNHVLQIIGLNLDYAPTVHFCNKKSTEAIVVQSELIEDTITVDIPNELLQEPYNIIAYIHTYDDNHAKTIELVNIPLIKRVKPSDYQFTENVEIMNFERLEKDFTDFVNQVEADFLEYKEEANAHIDKRIDDFIAQNNVNWDNILLKPDNIAFLNTEDNAEVEIPENMYTNSDTKDNVATFTSNDGSGDEWSEVETLVSGEKHSSIFSKISTMFKNIRYLFNKLGTTDISSIGDGTTTGAIKALDSILTDNKTEIYRLNTFGLKLNYSVPEGVTSANELLALGIYVVNTGISNLPSGTSNYGFIVCLPLFSTSSSFMVQLFINANATVPTIWGRCRNNGTWTTTGWTKLTT